MNIQTLKQHKREGGFTLVELAIVMIIIGLLIGGILKGQELIANSQVTATVAQIKGIDAAVSTFRDKYSALPGDINPANRLASCTAAPCSTAGDQDGRIEGAGTTAGATTPAITVESVRAFAHLSAADLLAGVEANGGAASLAFGQLLPEAKVGGGYTGIEFSTAGALNNTATAARTGHYLVMTGAIATASSASSVLNPARAAQIDRKLDDGQPNAGAVRSTTANCATAGVTGNYLESTDTGRCSMYMRIQG